MKGIKVKKIMIIAEAGVNHNGSLALAKQMVDAAKECGADIIKFQTAKAESLVSRFAVKADYQKKNTGTEESQLEMLRKLLLTYEEFEQLAAYCAQKEIQFLSTPFDLESIDFLSQFHMPFWKIPSGEITNYPYLVRLAKTGMPVMMSTGMCELAEVEEAVKVLKENGGGKMTLLHCNTEYPTPYEDVNLRAMETLRQQFGCAVGYSDHTKGIAVPVAAAAMGAAVIEKHFTLSREMEGPDHAASLEPAELKAMIDAVRNIEAALGDGRKTVTESERKNIAIARKSIVAARKICRGEKLTAENITTKRPGSGISPMRWNEALGTEAVRDFEEDELIEL